MDISYRLIRSSRKTLAIQITPSGEVILRCPKRCSRQEAESFLRSKEAWIRKHLESIAASPTFPVFTEAEVCSLAKAAAVYFPERVQYFAKTVGVSYGRVSIRSQRTRWGSCSGKGNLNFNCLLMLCPEAVRDYVVVHELCHRKHLDHSAEFWAEVAKHCPDYRSHKKWLKDNGASLISRLP